MARTWDARRGGLGRRRSLLVYDAFEAHVTESVIAAAWNDIPAEMVGRGITNNLDGSEDDLVYENSEELINDDSFVREMFESDSESDFEGFDV